MIEKIAGYGSQLADSLLFFAVGVLIGWGQSKLARERDTGVVIGKSVCIGGIAMAAGTVLIWVPDLPMTGLIGVAAMLGSLGNAGLERLLMRILETRGGGQS